MRNLLAFLIKYNYWLLFVLLEVICFFLLFRFNSYQGSVFFTSANMVSGKVYELSNEITGYFGLRKINHDLTRRNVQLELEVERLSNALKEYTQDTTAIECLRKEALEGYRLFDARVVNNTVTHTDNYITIDKGREEGIRPEMGVVSGNGVVGIVYMVGAHYSVVLPVLNSKSSISCKIKRTSYFGFLKWEGGSSQYAVVKDMPRHSEFSLGDTVVTSGHSAVFPSGIPIGTVNERTDSHDGLSYQLEVRLFTDFACLDDVHVIAPEGQKELMILEDSLGLLN